MKKFEEYIKEQLQKLNKNGRMKIAFVEGWSKRMQTAASSVHEDHLLTPILVFETKAQFEQGNFDQALEHIIIEENDALVNELIDKYVELRKGKEKREDVVGRMKKAPLFSAMLLETGKVNGAIGGVYTSTAEILSNAFRAIGPLPGIKTISSVMLMHKDGDVFTFSDISVNPSPDVNGLVDIATNATQFVESMDLKSKVAFLSFSTDGSAKTDETLKIAKATEEFNQKHDSKYNAIGEIQFDAAYDPDIRRSKYKKQGGFKKQATVYIFPDLASGNIGYKIAQRMGNWGAIGPVITGLKKPFNDLSRGSKSNDVLNTAIITAIQAHGGKDGK